MAHKVGKYKVSKREQVIDLADTENNTPTTLTVGSVFDVRSSSGDALVDIVTDAKDMIFRQYDDTEVFRLKDDLSVNIGTTGGLNIAPNANQPIIKNMTDAKDYTIAQYDGTEVARVLDGANLPSATGTSTSITSGNTGQGGFGFRRMVYNLGSGNDDNVLTLTAAQSGGVILVTPTNALSVTLPAGVPGIEYKFVIVDNVNKAFTIKTAGAGSDNNDNFYMRCQSLADDGATTDIDGDTLTFTNAVEGSWINLLCLQGGANEIWLAEVFSTDAIASTVADS